MRTIIVAVLALVCLGIFAAPETVASPEVNKQLTTMLSHVVSGDALITAGDGEQVSRHIDKICCDSAGCHSGQLDFVVNSSWTKANLVVLIPPIFSKLFGQDTKPLTGPPRDAAV